MSVQISYKRQVVLGLMFLLVILAGIEIIGRVVLDQRDSCNQSLPMSGLYEHLTVGQIKKICQDYQSIIQYPLPLVHYEPNQKTDTVTINSHGFRGEDFEKEKTNDGEYRIFMVGGSAMYGVYATSDGTTIPGYLQQLYNEFTVDHNIRVINGGANTHESFAETHLIKNKILGFNPDLIIVLDGWNDLNSPVKTEYNEPTGLEKIEQYSLVIRKYYKTIQFYEFLERVWIKQFDNEPRNLYSEDTMEEKALLWKSRWEEICELGEKENFKVIITLQPLLGAGNKELTDWELKNVKELTYQNPASSYHIMQNKLMELETKCTATEDLTGIFDDEDSLIYFDVGHMGDKGNGIIAQKIFNVSSPYIFDRQE